LNRSFSLSFSGGPQHSHSVESSAPPSSSWTPAATASIGWQGTGTSLAASYSRIVSGGGGLLGEFESTNSNISARWQITRTWSVNSSANYSINKNLNPLSTLSASGGHTLSGTASIQRSFGEHLRAEAGYTRLHESYVGIAVIAETPDTDRVSFSISYQLKRPLGR
jgi:hypothetical protein